MKYTKFGLRTFVKKFSFKVNVLELASISSIISNRYRFISISF